MNLLRVLYWHNKGHYRALLWGIANSVISLAVLFYTMQMFMGIAHFYGAVNQALAGAKIIHIDAQGNYIITPTNDTWSFWNPGQTLVITSDSRDMLGTIHTVINGVLGSIGGLIFFKEILQSRQQSRLEMEGRINDWRNLYQVTLNRKWIVKFATTQKVVFQLIAIVFSVLMSTLFLVPTSVHFLNNQVPGIGYFFNYNIWDMLIFSLPLIMVVGLGTLFTYFYTRKVLHRLT